MECPTVELRKEARAFLKGKGKTWPMTKLVPFGEVLCRSGSHTITGPYGSCLWYMCFRCGLPVKTDCRMHDHTPKKGKGKGRR